MHKVILLSLFVFICVALAQDTTELKVIKAPQNSLDQINQVPDREQEAINSQTTQAQGNINEAVQDNSQDTNGTISLITRIGNEKLTAVNKYEAIVLKSISKFHKLLAMQKARGLITEEQYNLACKSLIQTFRSAMLQRPLFKDDQS